MMSLEYIIVRYMLSHRRILFHRSTVIQAYYPLVVIVRGLDDDKGTPEQGLRSILYPTKGTYNLRN